ncbi:mitochondrial substrate carrier protein [Chloropicon primus]|uniref:Mitochondrial substrate carrier protein n=1 Tax=Chloropicon primus TaxID=1764295 RepID=A0A5B8MTX9_9CHLO|nr:mitochondrial substrate carrier protein [Chloropicon primus]UPR03174.1 mitochondrial substrate carrier protein [Chloropicon primus]|eukprot:QDZ23963.1 mitochondrial substrate carrier protein [Chloropicon primus]
MVFAAGASARRKNNRNFRKGGTPRLTGSGNIERIFEELDTDGSGEIDQVEIREGLTRIGLPSGDDYVQDLLQGGYDLDNSKTISKKEFVAYVKDKEQAMLKVFKSMDKDGSGTISGDEVVEVMEQMGIAATSTDGSRMIELLDENKDGCVTFEEFKKYTCLLPAAQLKSNAAYCWMGSSVDRVITNPREPLKQLVVGGAAGAASRFLTAPLQRVRVVLMASKDGLGIPGVVRQVAAKEGVLGFWRGSTPRILKVMPGSAIQFATFASVKNFFLKRSKTGEITVPQTLLAGATAGATACLVVYPFTSLAGQMSVANGVKGSIFTVSKQIYKTFGIKGFYKGLPGELMGDIWGFMLGFGLYDLANQAFYNVFKRKPRSLEKGLVGGSTACVSITTSMPLLLATTRMQVQGLPGYPVLYKNVLDCLVKTAQQEGVGGLWKGLVPSYAQIFPCIFISYFVYEALSKELGLGGLSKYSAKKK